MNLEQIEQCRQEWTEQFQRGVITKEHHSNLMRMLDLMVEQTKETK